MDRAYGSHNVFVFKERAYRGKRYTLSMRMRALTAASFLCPENSGADSLNKVRDMDAWTYSAAKFICKEHSWLVEQFISTKQRNAIDEKDLTEFAYTTYI